MTGQPAPPPADDAELLAEQREYYRRRAPEYDDWWQRRGRYESDEATSRDWAGQVAEVEQVLADFGAVGDVLEIAGGTGWWSQRLASTAERLTVLDSSPETLELNRARVARPDVGYEVADVFDWQPPRRFDVVFFSFWLSHVPRGRFAEFWRLVRSCLHPDGRVFLIDNRRDPSPQADDARRRGGDPYVVEYRHDLHVRTLGDGSHHRVVKVMYEPDELAARIDAEGWSTRLRGTRWFLYGEARPT